MTNEEWLESLAHNDIPALRAWFKAEHPESPESGALVHSAQSDVEQAEWGAEDDTDALNARIAELTAERDKLQEQLLIGWECECRLQAERDNLAKDLAMANNERERYRLLLGKALDYADAIHALADEGLA